jgi:hypothetical protein
MTSVQPPAESRVSTSWTAITAGVLGLAAVAGPLVGAIGNWALLGFIVLPIFLAIVFRPQLGVYLYLVAAPLIVGLPRDSIIPIIRPEEGMVILILAASGTRIMVDCVLGRTPRPVFDRIDLTLLLLAVTSSVIPLLLRFGRELPISTDDLLYALVLWKFYLIYRLFRYAVTTAAQLRVCLALAMLSSTLVALIAVLQVLGLFGVRELLWAYYDRPFEGIQGLVTERGTSTVALSFGMADMMAMSLAIALAWLPAQQPLGRKLVLGAAAGVFVVGCIVSGQYSGIIGLAVVVVTVGVITGQMRQLLAIAIPLTLAASTFLWPVIEKRLSDFSSLAGLPPSWVARLDNLERFVWPELVSGFNWLVGVRPAARIPAPEVWREWIYIESGYTWLLWTGGLPMLMAFILFVWVAFPALARVVRGRQEPTRVAAVASIAGLANIVILMLFDPHLTMRGSADLFFPLLALSFIDTGRERNPH